MVFQGDSLSILVADLHGALDQVRRGDVDDGTDELAAALESLEDVKRSYESVLATHSITLPYQRITAAMRSSRRAERSRSPHQQAQ